MVVYLAYVSREPISGPINGEPSIAEGSSQFRKARYSPERYLAQSEWDLIWVRGA